jgi:hypothetical protein
MKKITFLVSCTTLLVMSSLISSVIPANDASTAQQSVAIEKKQVPQVQNVVMPSANSLALLSVVH